MIKKGFKPAFICGTMVLAGILLFYVIPFISKDPQMFSKAMDTYRNAALGEWRGQHPEEKLKFMQNLHLIMSISVVFLMGLLFWLKRKQWDLRYFALGSLKIYLAFFYAFLQVPYYYLMMIPVAVSLVVIYCSFTFNIKKAPQ